jgi:hypothetical protein
MEPDTPQAEDLTCDELAIWRYMDLPRFVSMLATRGLWFAKAATLRDDPYEGFCKAICLETPPPDDGPKCIREETTEGINVISLRQMIARLSQLSAAYFENARDHLYVNSWCLGESESMAMWQIYGAFGFGVAVKSSVGRFHRSAMFDVDSSHYDFGKVTYHDELESALAIQRDLRGPIPVPGPKLRGEILKLGFHKRCCFRYENEWRAALYQDHRPDIGGINQRFDLEQLISAVYVGPRAEDFFFDVVSSIMDKFLLGKPLERSLLLSSPKKRKSLPAN